MKKILLITTILICGHGHGYGLNAAECKRSLSGVSEVLKFRDYIETQRDDPRDLACQLAMSRACSKQTLRKSSLALRGGIIIEHKTKETFSRLFGEPQIESYFMVTLEKKRAAYTFSEKPRPLGEASLVFTKNYGSVGGEKIECKD